MRLNTQKNLIHLAEQILLSENTGISKVRFAKTIYFVHKGLVQHSLANPGMLGYIRMPLGPVPVNFMELESFGSIATETADTGLSYDAKIYRLNADVDRDDSIAPTLDKILAILRRTSTSQLVEVSHRDPSWLNNVNGARYFITSEDLKNELPGKTRRATTDSALDEQHLQAQLIKGMLEDIVEESTSLEYPS
jgi:uncharacterized phage-associated protein